MAYLKQTEAVCDEHVRARLGKHLRCRVQELSSELKKIESPLAPVVEARPLVGVVKRRQGRAAQSAAHLHRRQVVNGHAGEE